MGLVFPPSRLAFLAWAGMAPLLYALRGGGALSAAFKGLLFGVVFGAGAFSWSTKIAVIGPVGFLLWLLTLSLYFLLFAVLYHLLCRGAGKWIVAGGPALWTGLEYARANLSFLAWPWNLVGHSQYAFLPVVQIADVTGVYGVSFLVLMVNEFLSRVPGWLRHSRTDEHRPPAGPHRAGSAIAVAAALGAALLYGNLRLGESGGGDSIRVALVQGNVLTSNYMSLEEQMSHFETYERLSMEAAREGPRLIVWPSSSLPAPLEHSRLVRKGVARVAYGAKAYLLVGGAGLEKMEPRREGLLPYSNSEFLVSPQGIVKGRYEKMLLLPFNEYLPMEGIIRWPPWITTLDASFRAGEKLTIFEAAGARFGAPICWENLFAGHFRRFVRAGADFMVCPTNEGFFGYTDGPYQTLAMSVFRAVENRVAIARAASTGVSAFISPAGRILGRVSDGDGQDLFVQGALVMDIPLSEEETFYTRHGDLFSAISGAIAISLCVVAAVTVHRREEGPGG